MAEFSGWPLIGSKFARFGGSDVEPRLRRALNQWPDSKLLQLSRTLWIDANAEVVLIQKEDGTAVNLQVNTQIGNSITKDTASITAGIGLTTPANGIIVTNTDTGTPTFTDVIVLGKSSHGYMDAKKSDGSVIFKADPITETYQFGLSSGTSTTTIYGETLVLSVLGSGVCLISGNGQITGVLESTVVTGTAPFTIASMTVNTNLNADLLDGNHASAFVALSGNLGTPASGTLTNCTGLPIVAGTTGTLSIARGGTGATSLTAGYVPVSSAGTSYIASQIRDDATSVGIGVAPATIAKFHILDSLVANSSQLRLTHTANVDYCNFIVDSSGVLTIAPSIGITQFYDGATAQSVFMYNGSTLDNVFSTGGNDSYIKTGPFAIGTDTPNEKLTVAGAVAITDGMTAPGTTAGYAKIYVDSADGDLKIKFGDGTVKTIVTDT